jgi:type II secretory pathway pseudopilin PulG
MLTNKKQRGFTSIELGIVLLVVAAFALVAMSVGPKVMYALKKYQLNKQVTHIIETSVQTKGLSPTFEGVTIASQCTSTRNVLDEAVCGASNDGKNANPFGGDFILSVNTNKSKLDLQINNLPTDRLDELADMLASSSGENCLKANGCSSVTTTSDSVTLTI